MTSSRPYLIRAIYEWVVDNGLTPYVVVNTILDGVVVPTQYIENGKIILNLSPLAVQALHLGNEAINFSARFGGVGMAVQIPPHAVVAIYAKENGKGMVFSEDETPTQPPTTPAPESGATRDKPPGRPVLTVVK